MRARRRAARSTGSPSGKASLYYDTKAQYVWALAFAGPDALRRRRGFPARSTGSAAAGKGERVHATPDAHVRALFVDAQGPRLGRHLGLGPRAAHRQGRPRRDRSTTPPSPRSPRSPADAIGPGLGRRAARRTCRRLGERADLRARRGAAPASRRRLGAPSEDDDTSKPEVSVSRLGARGSRPPRGSARGGYSSEVAPLRGGRAAARGLDERRGGRLRPRARRRRARRARGDRAQGQALRAAARQRWSLVRTFDEKQVTFVAGRRRRHERVERRLPAPAGARSAASTSRPSRTRARTSRFGAFRWEGDVAVAARKRRVRVPLRRVVRRPTRRGAPGRAWASGAHAAARSQAPDGRFLQWKARMSARTATQRPVVRRTEAAYRNRNAAPVVETLERPGAGGGPGAVGLERHQRLRDGRRRTRRGSSRASRSPSPRARRASSSGRATGRCSGRRPTRTATPLVYELEFRPVGGPKWILLRKDLRETFYSFDSTSLPDGDYVFRVTASDAESNPGRRARPTTRESAPVRIDNTPPGDPRVSPAPDGSLEVEATDAASPILEAEYSVDAKKWIRVEPKDGLVRFADGDLRRSGSRADARGALPARPRHRRGAQRRDVRRSSAP